MSRTKDRVTGVVIRGSQILMIHRYRDGKTYWVFPGGGVEEGEDYDTAIQREMQEETGLEVLYSVKLFEQAEANGGGCVFYTCELEAGEPHLGGPESANQSPTNQYHLVWVELQQLPRLAAVYPSPEKLLHHLQG